LEDALCQTKGHSCQAFQRSVGSQISCNTILRWARCMFERNFSCHAATSRSMKARRKFSSVPLPGAPQPPSFRNRRRSAPPLPRMRFSEEFFMSRCGATFEENTVPLGQGGTSGGFWERDNQIHPGAPRPLSFRLLSPFGKGDFQRSASSEGGLGESLLLCPSLNPIHFTATSPF